MKPQAAPARMPAMTATAMGMSRSSSFATIDAERVSAAGWLRSRMPPLMPTSACATASTPTIAMVKVIASTVWCDRKSAR